MTMVATVEAHAGTEEAFVSVMKLVLLREAFLLHKLSPEDCCCIECNGGLLDCIGSGSMKQQGIAYGVCRAFVS